MPRPAANAVLTTALDTCGRSWTPRCPGGSSGLHRWPAMDSPGLGNSPEKRKADCLAIVSAASDTRCTAELDRTRSSGAAQRHRVRRSPRRAQPWKARPARPRRPRTGSAADLEGSFHAGGVMARPSLAIPIVRLTPPRQRRRYGPSRVTGRGSRCLLAECLACEASFGDGCR